MKQLTRRQFLAAVGGSATAVLSSSAAATASTARLQLPNPPIGITLSHYEFDFELLTDGGVFASIDVANGGQMSSVMGAFDVLRFMNWQKTNVTWMQPPPATVADFEAREARVDWRVPPLHGGEYYSIDWGRSLGVPLHACLSAAKQVQANPWICVPHGASVGDFTALMQTMVDQTLDALAGTGLRPIFEFSNELWNGSFRQQDEVARIMLGRAPANGSERFTTALDYQVQRTNELAEYVQGRGDVVLSAQCYNPFVAKTLLGKGLSQYVTALAVAPYFGIVRDAQYTDKSLLPFGFHPLRDVTTGEAFDMSEPYRIIEERLALNLHRYINLETAKVLREHRVLLDAHNGVSAPLKLWAYEGGPDLHWRDNAPGNEGFDFNFVRELYLNFNRSEAMAHLVRELKQLWVSAEIAGDLFNGYSSATVFKNYGVQTGQLNYDNFGFLEVSAEVGPETPHTYKTTPKYHALVGDQAVSKRIGFGRIVPY